MVTDTGGDFLTSGLTLSFFSAIQVDPRSEDSAGPQFVVAEDLNGDGLLDLASAWYQSQPVQVHLQRRAQDGAISFETLTLAGNIPVVSVAGLTVADFDSDGRPDIAVLAKNTGLFDSACLANEVPEEGLNGLIVIYLGPEDPEQVDQALAWEEVIVGASFLQGTPAEGIAPEAGGFTSLVAGDLNEDGDMDLVVAWNSSCGGGTADVLVFTNQGPGPVRDGTWIGTKVTDPFPKGTAIKDVALGDIDGDGDLDIVATLPDSGTMNVRWFRNPTRDTPDDYHISDGAWQVGTVGQIATMADTIELADIDGDGILDVAVRSALGGVVQWLKGPTGPTTDPIRHIPWQVYTLAEFPGRTPETIALGHLDSDDQLELIVAAQGGLAWFDSTSALTVFDPWTEHPIVNDAPAAQNIPEPIAVDSTANGTAANDPGFADQTSSDADLLPQSAAGATLMNTILVVDLDDDGANDLIVTFDRAGLSDDAIVWFRNTRLP
jgi:hypothetical protein